MLEKLTPEQCEKILNTKYTASDIKSQMERLEEIKEQLRKPGEVTFECWICREQDGDLLLNRQKPFIEDGEWMATDVFYELSSDLCPTIDFGNSPKKVRITITPME